MHIVQLIPELNQGGVEQVVMALHRGLIESGHQSTVLSAGGTMVRHFESDNGQHIQLDICSKNPFTVCTRVLKLKTLLLKLNPDILHVHSRVPAWLAYFANKKLNIPWITSVHGFNSVSAYSRIMTAGDRVICVSNPVKNYILQHYQPSEKKISVIHPGIDPVRFNPETVDQTSIDSIENRFHLQHKTVVSSIGRITELKDYETFILGIEQASRLNPMLRGLIVGHVRHNKQAYYQRLIDLIKERKLEDIVYIATDLTDMPAVYALSHLVVSCSQKPESFGLTLIEALAMNTPVIATRHGGPLDIIRENREGAFFTPQHPDELAALLVSTNPQPSHDLRNETIHRFSINKMIDSTIAVYNQLNCPRQ